MYKSKLPGKKQMSGNQNLAMDQSNDSKKNLPKCIRCKLPARTVTRHLMVSEECMKFVEDKFPTLVRMMKDSQYSDATLSLLEALIVEFFGYAETYCLSNNVLEIAKPNVWSSKNDVSIRNVATLSLAVSCPGHAAIIEKDFSSNHCGNKNACDPFSFQSVDSNPSRYCRNDSRSFSYLTEFIERLNGRTDHFLPPRSLVKNNGKETTPERTKDVQLYPAHIRPKFANQMEDLLICPYNTHIANHFSLEIPVESKRSSSLALSQGQQLVAAENEPLNMFQRHKEPPNKFRIDFEKLLSISRKISALESILGVLGPKATYLLMKLVSIRNVDFSTVDDVILTDENGTLLETVREKLAALTKACTLDSRTQMAAVNVINDITDYLGMEEESIIII